MTVVLVTCSYREKEFVRVGYYVNNEYAEPYDEEAGPPMPLDMSKVRRAVLSEKPRVTRFAIPWGDKEESENAGQIGEVQQLQPQEEQGKGVQMPGEGGGGMKLGEGGADDDVIDEDEDIADESEEEDDDVSVEGKDMMMEDVMMGNAITATME